MQDDTRIGPGGEGHSAPDDLEDFLMSSVGSDDRFGNGSTAHEGDNVLDFIQMTGLATSSRRAYSDDEEFPSGDTVSFFEEGVGDVDATMDPMAPILPEMDIDASLFPDAVAADSPGESVQELNKLITELNDLESTDHDSDEASESSRVLPEEQDIFSDAPDPLHETATSRAFAELAELSGGKVEVLEETKPEVGYSEPEAADVAIMETVEAESTAPINDLQEAKTLLDELDVGSVPSVEPTAPAEMGTALPVEAPLLGADDAQNSGIFGNLSQSYQRQRHRRRRRFGRWGVRIVSSILILGVLFAGLQFYMNQAQTPADAYQSAEALLAAGLYMEASKEFQTFVRRFPTELKTSDAMFMAGYSMQLAPPAPRDQAEAAYGESLELLERFVVENPGHSKAARAETLAGVLYFKMDMPVEAIRILSGSERRLRDPGAYLTTLRTLGRAYASVSQIENARSAFMRAASLQENIAPDEDYVELGAMYHTLAQRSATAEVERDYRIRAIEQWDYALRVPGLLKSRREEIRLTRDIVASSVDEADIAKIPAHPEDDSPTSS